MKLLSSLAIGNKQNSAIELLHGDLSAIPAEHAVDILVVSAFPDSYIALPGSLFEALGKKNLSLESVAQNKEIDLRAQLGCWFSKPLSPAQRKQFNFTRILCFEPRIHSTDPAEVVGNLFRCINNFAFDKKNNSIAMPILASGYQKVPIAKMLPALLQTAIFWLQNGLPLHKIKLVIYREEEIPGALQIFEEEKQQTERLPVAPPQYEAVEPAPEVSAAEESAKEYNAGKTMRGFAKKEEKKAVAPASGETAIKKSNDYDIFISYAHKHSTLVNTFVKAIQKQNDALNIFYDRNSIKSGDQWLKLISNAIQQSRKVLILLSPDYSNSPVCWDEFQCAKLVEYNSNKRIIQTIYLYSDKDLPPIMGIHSYIDCREGSSEKLEEAIKEILAK